MTSLQPGDLWLADILFTNGAQSKRRPVLVLWVDGQDAIVAVVTSARPRSATDVPLLDWQSAGLVVASTVRLARLDSLETALLLRRLGHLSGRDARSIMSVWARQMKLSL